MVRRATKVRPVRSPEYFIVGDSTATVIQDNIPTPGMAKATTGYTPESSSGLYFGMPGDPTRAYRAVNAPCVVMFAALWDFEATDLSAYTAALAYFESFGVPVYVWGMPAVPGWPAMYGGPISQAAADAWNADLATELGQALDDDGSSRYVSVANGLSSDDIHPNAIGWNVINQRIITAVGFADESRVRNGSTAVRGALGPTVYARTRAPAAATGRPVAAKTSIAVTRAPVAATSRAVAAKTANVVTRAVTAATVRATAAKTANVVTRMAAASTIRAVGTTTRTAIGRLVAAVVARVAGTATLNANKKAARLTITSAAYVDVTAASAAYAETTATSAPYADVTATGG